MIKFEDVVFNGKLNTINIEGDVVKVAVHDGVFHADDVLCVCMLKYAYAGEKRIQIIRSRNLEILKSCHYILDVGNKDSVRNKQIWLDHHDEPQDRYRNYIKYAACGKLADILFVDYPELLAELRKQLIWPIEIQDNGQDAKDFSFPISGNKFAFVASFNPTWLEQAGVQQVNGSTSYLFDEAFTRCVDTAMEVFYSIMHQCWANIFARKEIKKSRINNSIIYLDNPMPWQEYVIEFNKLISKEEEPVKLVRFKGSNGEMLQVVPVALGTFNSWIKLPESWAGKKGQELAEAIKKSANTDKLPDGECIFCHPARFIAGFSTAELADYAATIAMG